jgi:hypothetical protein
VEEPEMLKKMIAGLVVILSTTLIAASDDLWLHVFVQEDGASGETVRVNVPVAFVERVLPLIENEHIRGGKVVIPDEAELEGVDLRGIWEAVRETADGEFVTVEGPDENVRVAKQDGMILVDVDDDGEKVRVRVPLEVVGAAFSGEPDQIDIVAAIRLLGESYPDHDLVTVEDGSTTVRVWIDTQQEMDL